MTKAQILLDFGHNNLKSDNDEAIQKLEETEESKPLEPSISFYDDSKEKRSSSAGTPNGNKSSRKRLKLNEDILIRTPSQRMKQTEIASTSRSTSRASERPKRSKNNL